MFCCFPEEVARLAPELYTRYFKLFFGKVYSFDEKDIMCPENRPRGAVKFRATVDFSLSFLKPYL